MSSHSIYFIHYLLCMNMKQMSSFICLAKCFQNPSTFLNELAAHYFSLLHCMNTPQFVHSFPSWQMFGLFLVLTMSKSAINIHVQKFLWTYVFMCPWSKIACQRMCVCLRNCQFSKMTVPFYTPTNNLWEI